MSDVRAVLERIGARVELDDAAFERLARRRREAHRRRRVLAGVLAVALAATGTFVASLAFRQSPPAAPSVRTWQTFRSAEGWALDYPSEWRAQPFETHGLIDFSGVVVTNVDFRFRHPEIPNGWTSAWDMRGLPGDAVVVQFEHSYRLPFGRPLTPEDLPLSLDDAEALTGHPNDPTWGAPEPVYYIPVDKTAYKARVWFGPLANQQDKRLAEAILRSLRLERTGSSATRQQG